METVSDACSIWVFSSDLLRACNSAAVGGVDAADAVELASVRVGVAMFDVWMAMHVLQEGALRATVRRGPTQ
jgi:hypothetical protein